MMEDAGKITDLTLVSKKTSPGRENPKQCLARRVAENNDVIQKLAIFWGQEYTRPETVTYDRTDILRRDKPLN